MDIPASVFVGYFPKITAKKDVWAENEIVEEVCSVSECISEAPKDWIDKWEHNDFGFYDTEELASKIISGDSKIYDLYAYRLFPIKFDKGQISNIQINSGAKENLNLYKFIGYDVVSKSISSNFFECSPLSCNNAWEVYPVNRYCLIDKLEDAYKAAIEISNGNWEPGPYYCFEVFKKTGNVK